MRDNGHAGATGPKRATRGLIQDLESPHPIGLTLPGVLQDDEFAQRFVSGLDTVVAPVFSTLDNIDAYFDPQLAPADFLPWLAGWLAVDVDPAWPEQRIRDLLSKAADLQAKRGTVTGLRDLITLHTGAVPIVSDSGGASWSPVPGGELPGFAEAVVTVRAKPDGLDQARIEQLVSEGTPAHVVQHVVVEGPEGEAE
ncbi:MAG: phage tail protein I [Nitriliruptorales bacterium]|nr:phage tail protein I [Nitriliruptorales bacterium]